MRDENKTKVQLIEELAETRQRIAELEAVETERKRAEERFRSTFENTTIGLYRTTPDGRILMANPALVRMLGYSSFEELAQQNLKESGYEPGYLRSAFKQRIESEEQIIGLEAGWLKRDGGTVFVRESARAIRDEAGNTLYYVGTVEDITEWVRTEEALRQRSRELALLHRAGQAFSSTLNLDQVLITVLEEVRQLLDVVACSVWLTDPQTDELVCQQVIGPQSEIVRGWRLAPGEGLAGWVVQSGKSLIVPDTRADERHFKGVDEQTGLKLRSILSVPLRVKQVVIGVLQVVDGKVNRFGAIDARLMEPLAAAAAVAIENARLYQETDWLRTFNENIVRDMEEGILLEDATGHITFVNPRTAELLGYTAEELMGRHYTTIVAPEYVAQAEEETTKRFQGIASRYEMVLLTKGGERVPVIVSARPLFDEIPGQGGAERFSGVLTVFTDITERKRAEEALREAGERYRAIFEQAANSILLIDAQTGALVEFNDRAHESLGYTRQEFQKLKIPDFEIIESTEEVARHLEKIVKEGADTFETKHRTKDGEIRDILVSSRAISIRGRDFAQNILRDITERVRAEEALEQRVAQLALLNDIGEKIAAVLELDSVLDRAAHLVQESFGYHHVALFTLDDRRGELVMRARAGAFTHLFPPDHRLELDQGMVGWVGRHGQSLLVNDVNAEPRYVNLYPDMIPTRSELSVPIRVAGEVVGVLDVQSPQPNAFDEKDVMVIETLADQMAVAIENARLFEAEQRKRQEAEALREASLVLGSTLDVSQMLDQLLEQIGRVIPYDSANVILIEEGTARVAHQRWYEQFGTVAAAAALHLPVEQIPNLRRMLNTHRPHIIPDTGSDPGWVYLETSPWVRAWAGAPIVVRGEVIGFFSLNSKTQGSYALEQAELLSAFATDAALAIENAQLFTEVQRHADELEQRVAERTRELAEAYEQLKELDRLKSKFVTDVSHELRTPAANIKLYLHLLQRGKPEKRSHYLAITNDQVNRLTSLIEDILDLSRLDMAEIKVEFAAVDLNAVVEQVVAAHRPRAEAASLELTFEPKVALPPVLGEHNQLSRVVANLVGNAVNYTPAGQVRVSTHLDKERQRACLEVQDTGRGIEEEDLAHIFERFYRGREVGSSAIPGTGLGLAVVKEIVELHGGTIKVESQVGQGSTFTVWLPLEEGEEQSPVNLPGHREAW